MQHRLVKPEPPHLDRDVGVPERLVGRLEGRVGPREGDDDARQEDYATGGLETQKLPESARSSDCRSRYGVSSSISASQSISTAPRSDAAVGHFD
jgi:hypothetical protein